MKIYVRTRRSQPVICSDNSVGTMENIHQDVEGWGKVHSGGGEYMRDGKGRVTTENICDALVNMENVHINVSIEMENVHWSGDRKYT